jgi:hypothetical protein
LSLFRTNLTADCGSALATAIERNDTILFCDVGMNFVDAHDLKRLVDKCDENLLQYEQQQRYQRTRDKHESEIQLQEKERIDKQAQDIQIANWSQQRARRNNAQSKNKKYLNYKKKWKRKNDY